MHTVSVMCEHTASGAYGLVINKQSSLTLDRLLPEHPVFGEMRTPVGWGGPVGTDTLQIVHRLPDRVSGGFEVAEGLFLGGELDEVAMLCAESDGSALAGRLRWILGYAGWGAGQLELELASGSWLPLPMDGDLLFRHDQEATWQSALRSLGAEGQGLAELPPDIGWN